MEEQLTITQEIEMVDEFDKFLIEEVLLIAQNASTFSIVEAWGYSKFKKDKTNEEFFEKIMMAVNALIKANALRRNYHTIKDLLNENIGNSPDIKGTNVDLLFNKADAFILFEGFFVQIKTSLDLLAHSLKPMYGIDFRTWKRRNNVSGMAIVNSLNNLNSQLKPHAAPLVKLITENAETITKIVAHRDDTAHFGKLNNVQGFRYSVSRNEVISPLILISKNESVYVHQYLDEVLKYIAVFTQAFILIILNNLLKDMYIVKRSDGSWGWASSSLSMKIEKEK